MKKIPCLIAVLLLLVEAIIAGCATGPTTTTILTKNNLSILEGRWEGSAVFAGGVHTTVTLDIYNDSLPSKGTVSIQNIPERQPISFRVGSKVVGGRATLILVPLRIKVASSLGVEEGILVNFPSLKVNRNVLFSKVNRNLMDGFTYGVQKEPQRFIREEVSFGYLFFIINTEHWAPKLPITKKL